MVRRITQLRQDAVIERVVKGVYSSPGVLIQDIQVASVSQHTPFSAGRSINVLPASSNQCLCQRCKQCRCGRRDGILCGGDIISLTRLSTTSVSAVTADSSAHRRFVHTSQRAASKSTTTTTTNETDGSRVTDVAKQEEEFNRIAKDDPIFRKPVGAVEGTGWSLVIAAGLAVACIGMYSIAKEFVSTPKEQIVYE